MISYIKWGGISQCYVRKASLYHSFCAVHNREQNLHIKTLNYYIWKGMSIVYSKNVPANPRGECEEGSQLWKSRKRHL